MTSDHRVEALLERAAADIQRKQRALAERVGERDWLLDLERGSLTFGDDIVFAVQLLGTESTETWMWAWANDAIDVSEDLLRDSLRVRRHGEQHGVELLTIPRIGLATLDAHRACMIGTALCDPVAYYAGAHALGRVAVLLYENA